MCLSMAEATPRHRNPPRYRSTRAADRSSEGGFPEEGVDPLIPITDVLVSLADNDCATHTYGAFGSGPLVTPIFQSGWCRGTPGNSVAIRPTVTVGVALPTFVDRHHVVPPLESAQLGYKSFSKARLIGCTRIAVDNVLGQSSCGGWCGVGPGRTYALVSAHVTVSLPVGGVL